jgi:hypothetical protein
VSTIKKELSLCLHCSQNLVIGACSLYNFGFATGCASVGCICIIRIVCLVNISFMEEIIGETLVSISSFYHDRYKKLGFFSIDKRRQAKLICKNESHSLQSLHFKLLQIGRSWV